ncbi:PREDICTED: uncharacterized protein LOC109467266 [Branchiostoma belcheri]|uniref:Uncharacterized protein LOC109467266 n=1 Tax=Branchiostoma belcheri TaxID=7741 RepID=A0A6P4XVV0_BRABE|nr:PREDICTED: uncharacterized protein LOC109467266 [Branchiostoma belcheri]
MSYVKKWVGEKISSVRRWWSPEKAKPRLPRTNGRDYSCMKDSFENLVLKGGGAKGIAYIGAAKVLDEARILPNIKRFAGTSAGAITATMLAIGMKPEEMLEELSQRNLMDLLDPPVGLLSGLSKLPRILFILPSWLTMKNISMALSAMTDRGACEGDEFLDWFGDILDRHLARLHPFKKGLDKDITFDTLYHVLGKELCIVAYNMVLGNEIYFHVKTTPMMKIKEAVRMSMSIPGVFKPFGIPGSPYTFIDGGLAANYPLWAFDGWYLSMKEEDFFQERLMSTLDAGQTVRQMFHPEYRRERFGTRNDKTLGILLFSSEDREMYQEQFEKRQEEFKPAEIKPEYDTELYKDYKEKTEKSKKEQIASYEKVEVLVGQDVKRMIEGTDGQITEALVIKRRPDLPVISKEEAKQLFNEIFSEEDLAFLGAPSKEEAFDFLMINEEKNLTSDRLRKIYKNFGPLQLARRAYLGHRLVSTPRQYFGTMLEFVGRQSGITDEDVPRSIAIDVGYVGTMDFDMATEDMEFLMRQGAAGTIAFLEEKKDGLGKRRE